MIRSIVGTSFERAQRSKQHKITPPYQGIGSQGKGQGLMHGVGLSRLAAPGSMPGAWSGVGPMPSDTPRPRKKPKIK